jgi:hypothetical protein
MRKERFIVRFAGLKRNKPDESLIILLELFVLRTKKVEKKSDNVDGEDLF